MQGRAIAALAQSYPAKPVRVIVVPLVGGPESARDRFLDLMAVDKKVRGGRLRLVLLRDIGEAVLTDEFDPGLLRATLEAG